MMLLKSGDSSLNRFSQAFGESVMGSLKQAILEQELTFRNQVRELHRLYWTQKNLMKELRQNGVNPQVGNALYKNEGVLFRNHQKIFNLQFQADAFISIDLNNNNNNSLLETDVSKADGKFDVQKNLFSSLGSSCNEIVDLEGSMDLDSHEKAKASLKENNACCVPSTVHFGEEQDRRLKEQMAHVSCVGIVDSSVDSVNDHSKITHESKTVLFDLNIPTRDSEVHSSSQDSMLVDNNAKNFNDFESKLDSNGLSSAYPVEGSTGSSDGALISINGTPISSIDLSKQEKGASPSNKLLLVALSHNNWQDSNITSRNSINLLQTVTRDSTEKLCNLEESEEDNSLLNHATAEDEDQQNKLLGEFYVGYNSNNMSECSSYEKGAQEAATLSITDGSVITQSHSTENEMSYFGKFKSEEQEIATTAAAQTLMAISFGVPAIKTNKFDGIEVIEDPCEDKSDKLPVSSDSFETMTMDLSEIQNDEIWPVMPRLNVREKDEMRVRPRRGKGLRNFQKEILPGLVSLSRHEICEDLYSINYKFRRNIFSTTGNFFAPVTSRRSRLYSRRRRRLGFHEESI